MIIFFILIHLLSGSKYMHGFSTRRYMHAFKQGVECMEINMHCHAHHGIRSRSIIVQYILVT